MIDVAIVGGGVAGSTTAMVLARRGIVRRRDRAFHLRQSADWRNASARDPGHADGARRLGTLCQRWSRPQLWHLCRVGTSALQANDFIFNPYGHGWHINRSQFDRMLAAAAREAGVVIRERTRLISHRPIPDGWELQIGRPEQPERLLARFLVDASGRASCVARANGARRVPYDRLVGIARIHAVQSCSTEQDSFTMVEAVQGGWWYSAFLPGNQLITVFLTDSDLRPQQLELRETQHTCRRLGCCEDASPPFVFSANSARLSHPVGPRWLAVGDAACALDPFHHRAS